MSVFDRNTYPSGYYSVMFPTRLLPRLVAGALLATAALTGCSDASGDSASAPAIASSPGGQSISNGTQVSVAVFRSHVDADGTVVLDVRTPAEFETGHLPGARNLDSADPHLTERLGDLDRSAPYAVYCQSGNRSARVVQTMVGLGFTDVVDLAGGIGAWSAAGGPVVTDE